MMTPLPEPFQRLNLCRSHVILFPLRIQTRAICQICANDEMGASDEIRDTVKKDEFWTYQAPQAAHGREIPYAVDSVRQWPGLSL